MSTDPELTHLDKLNLVSRHHIGVTLGAHSQVNPLSSVLPSSLAKQWTGEAEELLRTRRDFSRKLFP
jgi:hypothetical protein